MMKKALRNYNYSFDKNERKMINAFTKQLLKQVAGDPKFFQVEKAFNSVLEKVNSGDEVIRLTKTEVELLSVHLKENVRALKTKMKNTWFLMRWIYKSMLMQYESLYENHFKE